MPLNDKLLDKIAQAYKDEPNKWNLSQERAFQEDLMYRGFHFFILFFSLAIGGAITARTHQHLCVLLTIGTLVSFAMFLPIYRARVKLLLILQILHRIEKHPVCEVGKLLEQSGIWPTYSVVHLIGLWIPLACCTLVLTATVLAWAGILHSS
ncbi:MAG TPA: hypothetical protein VGZ47_06810 [Gemmataceae bacterium]|jgi:hypothetical protein|nr:hypothetical protein [Gemmataceae bacterium]